MEEITILIPGKLNIIQHSNFFKFGNDSVFLANFTKVRKGSLVVDFGTGSGVIPLLLAYKQKPSKVVGIEIQDKLVDMARRSVAMNNLEEKIDIIKGNFNEASKMFEVGTVDLVVSNPPYTPLNSGKITLGKEKAIARHEIHATVNDLIREAATILRFNGRMTMIHKAYRLSEIIELMKEYSLEPKRIRLIQSRRDAAPKTVLIEAIKGGRPGLVVEPVLLVYEDESEEYTVEVKDIYGDGYSV